jgi:Protease inhibitor Inh
MSRCSRPGGHSAIAAILMLTLVAAGGCTSTQRFAAAPGEQAEASPPQPPPPQPPPVDLGGRWRLSMAAAGGCVMTFTDARGAAEGTIAPAGGCPANFFTSRKWTFERDRLIIRDHKGEPLAELSFAAGRFQGNVAGGGSVDLARP